MIYKKSRFLMLFFVLIMIFILQSSKVAAEMKENILLYEGIDYSVELIFQNNEDISENTSLKVTEFYEGSAEYQEYYSQTKDYVKENMDNVVSYVRFFDICILEGEEEIEPDDTVEVSIKYKDGIEKGDEESISVIHFVEDGSKELLEVISEGGTENEVTQVSFEQDSFSVIGMIVFSGVDTSVKEVNSETITGTSSVSVEKEWSDGKESHIDDAVTVTLYEVNSENWNKCDELILNHNNKWKASFTNLDVNKEYGIKETNVISEDLEKTDSYKSEIVNTSRKEWCQIKNNELTNGQGILLIFNDGYDRLMRRSGTYEEFNLRVTNPILKEEPGLGKYNTSNVEVYYIWTSIWNEEHEAWELYTESGNAYLTLIYNEGNGRYEWTTSREKTEGSYLTYEDGIFSATVNGVKKYLGNVSGNGPYEGVDEDDRGIVQFSIFTYQIYNPGNYLVINTKNESIESQEINISVTTEKNIDYLGDNQNNPDTDVDDKLHEKVLKDLYRLNLSMKMQTDVTGLDLLLVIDVSSSMKENKDSIDANGNNILRSEALRQALNQFVPGFIPDKTKNRLSIVAFENQSIILQEWTQNAKEVLDKVNYEADGDLPLYSGTGTNYESALIRAHEAFSMKGYSDNAQAMIFLSDGEPTVYMRGNDDLEKGNVTVNLGETYISDTGIEGAFPNALYDIWIKEDNGNEVLDASAEAVDSFKKHNPGIMIGTIAFNTKITNCLKNLATERRFVTQIENGSPDNLIEAMELITKFIPKEMVIIDELSENVELYDEEPDYKVSVRNGENNETILFDSENGITDKGREVLDENNPLAKEGNELRVTFNGNYEALNGHTYSFSYNVKASQKAYDKYSDLKGSYSSEGDDNTDYPGNDTSSLKEGFYSNGDNTKLIYTMNGAKNEKKFHKPVIQADEGKLVIKKVNQEGVVIDSGAEFSIYRAAKEHETDTVSLEGVEGKFVVVAAGKTDENGEIMFEHMRLAVFDAGYPYYLVEEKAPNGYTKIDSPIPIYLFRDNVKLKEDYLLITTEQMTLSDGEKAGLVTVKNEEEIAIPVTGGSGTIKYFMSGLILILGGIIMNRKKLSKYVVMFMTFVMAFQVISMTALAIEDTDRGKITVNGVEEDAKVSAYRLMDIHYDYNVDQPKNPMYRWVEGVADWINANYPDYIDNDNMNAVNEAFSTAEEAEIAEFYDKLAVAIKDGTVSILPYEVEAEDETVVIDNLIMGNYFILIEGGFKVYRPLSANVVPEWKEDVWQMSNPVVVAKASAPSITKVMVGGIKEDNVNIGDTVSFELSAVIPDYPENAKAKMFVVSDQLSEGLTLVDDSLKIYGVNSGKEDELLTGGYARGTERTIETENEQVTFALDFEYTAICDFESLKITYDAVLNENAVVGEEGNGNIAFLDFSNNPYVAENYTVDGDETTVYTYGIKISKVDEDSNDGLSGAEFTLSKDGEEIRFSGENGVYHVAGSKESGSNIVAVDKDGLLTLKGLDVGTYSLTEVKAPDGYVKLQNSIEIVIADDNMNGKIETSDQELSDGYMPVTVKNDKGFTLPVTGGMGTTLFNIAGIVLMGSGLLLIVSYVRKRNNSR